MDRMIFLNLPISDLKRSRAFYAGLGFAFDERFSDEQGACVVVSPTIYFMILEKAKFAQFSPKPIADTQTVAGALYALSCESREEVDRMVEAAVAHGGTDTGVTDEMGGYMYGRGFFDPDGHGFGPMWMDVEAAMKDWGKAEAG